MGIDLKWKALLKEKFPYCFPDGIPSDTDIAITDILIELRKWTYHVYSGLEFEVRVIKSITDIMEFKPEKIFFCIDEKEFVPKCKQTTWDDRKK